ncbi:hypothetical protein AN958_12756 [Leucoagaricus sp. SymC.cos]|nr:hypothetical protein AN958_12756 [Leucoagaricus sp. SymC.cos]
MLSRVVRIDEDIVKIDSNADIKEVREDVVHEMLESSRSISETKRHYQPFEGTIAGPKSSFPLIAFIDMDKIVGMLQVYLGVQAGFAGSIQEIRNKREWVAILFGNVVETTEIDAKMQGTVFFLNKKNRSTMRRRSRMNKTN